MAYDCKNWLEAVLLADEALLEKCKITSFKGSGPGGQNRNKISNGVKLDYFHITASYLDNRSKNINLIYALRKLRLAIALDYTPSIDNRPKRNAADWFKIYNGSKLFLCKDSHKNYPIVCGFLMDYYLNNRDWKKLASSLEITNSALSSWFNENYQIKKMLLLFNAK